jgi:hypothetical protein
VAFDAEPPVSAEPLPAELVSLAGVAGAVAAAALEVSVEPAAGAEPVASAPEPDPAGGETGAEELGDDAEADSLGVAGAAGTEAAGADDVVPPAGVVDVGVPATGSPFAADDAAPVPALDVDAGADPPVGAELELVVGEVAVDVEVAPLDVVAVEETDDAVAPAEVELTVPGASSGALTGLASGLLLREAARRDGMEASSVSRAVGGAVAG